MVDDLVRYPEYGLRTRTKLIFEWIPAGATTLLDVGCSYGSNTRAFALRVPRPSGVDPNEEYIARARLRSPSIDFRVAGAERLPFDDGSFDVIVMGDVLEHVLDQRATLNEVFRVLRDGGSFILTVPHKGVFGFIDVDNVMFLKQMIAGALRRRAGTKPNNGRPAKKPGYEGWHRHYSVRGLLDLLDESSFANHYDVIAVRRPGLILEALFSFLFLSVQRTLGPRVALKLSELSQPVLNAEYAVSFGRFAYNLALHVRKRTEK